MQVHVERIWIWKPEFTGATLIFLLIRYFKPLQFIVDIASEQPRSHSLIKMLSFVSRILYYCLVVNGMSYAHGFEHPYPWMQVLRALDIDPWACQVQVPATCGYWLRWLRLDRYAHGRAGMPVYLGNGGYHACFTVVLTPSECRKSSKQLHLRNRRKKQLS